MKTSPSAVKGRAILASLSRPSPVAGASLEEGKAERFSPTFLVPALWPARLWNRLALCGAFPCLWCAHGARTAKLLRTGQRRIQCNANGSGEQGACRKVVMSLALVARRTSHVPPPKALQKPPAAPRANFFHFFSKTPLRGVGGFGKLLIRSPPTRGHPGGRDLFFENRRC